MSYNNLIDVIRERSAGRGSGITFIDTPDEERFLSYDELYHTALKVLSALQDKGMRPGDELVFQIIDNRNFLVLFWAALLGGIVPVPLTVGKKDEHRLKLLHIWPLLNAPRLACAAGELIALQDLARTKGYEHLSDRIGSNCLDEAELLASNEDGVIVEPGIDDTAFIQFSSGSTGNPRGVILTHRNLMTNLQSIAEASQYVQSDSLLSWMPLTHDMGLIGFHINPLFHGLRHFLMSPQLFIRQPALWLEKASAHRVSVLSSPNFGYEHFLRNCHLPSEEYDWDLSCVRMIYNGAEPISEGLCRRFLETLTGYGLDRRSLRPVYGLAEGTVAVTISSPEEEVMAFAAERASMRFGSRVRRSPAREGETKIINVGQLVGGCLLRIADENDGALT